MSAQKKRKNIFSSSGERLTSQKQSNRSKRTSHFILGNESDEESAISNQQKKLVIPSGKSRIIEAEKAFQISILFEACCELLCIYSPQFQDQIDTILQNSSLNELSLIMSERLQCFTSEYVGSEFKYITVKEEMSKLQENLSLTLQNEVLQDDGFQMYSGLQEENLKWKNLFFSEARTVVELCQQLRESAGEQEQLLNYFNKCEERMKGHEEKYLNLFELYHRKPLKQINEVNERRKPRQESKESKESLLIEKGNPLVQQVRELSDQILVFKKQCVSQQKRIQEEFKQHQAIQELRIVDLQYIMTLENKLEQGIK